MAGIDLQPLRRVRATHLARDRPRAVTRARRVAEPRRPTTKKKGRGRYESVAVEPAVEPPAAPPPPKAKPKRKKEKEKRGRGASRAAASEVSELLDQD